MDIKEVKRLKNRLEQDIDIYVSELLEKFTVATGCSFSSVNICIDMATKGGIGEKPRYLVTGVDAQVEI